MAFAQPLWFLLLPLPLQWAALAGKRGAQGEDGAWLLRHPHLSGGSSAPPSPLPPLVLNTLAFLLLVLAVAQPREIGRWIAPPPEGRDIALVIDTSLTAAEVAAVLRLATEHRFPVIPRGAGSGKSGGALPVKGGVVLSTERMNRILAIDSRNFSAKVEPGVITSQFQEEVEKRDLFYPPDPASFKISSIGGIMESL